MGKVPPATTAEADRWLAAYGVARGAELNPYAWGGVSHALKADTGPLEATAAVGLSIMIANPAPFFAYVSSQGLGVACEGAAEALNPGDRQLQALGKAVGQIAGGAAGQFGSSAFFGKVGQTAASEARAGSVVLQTGNPQMPTLPGLPLGSKQPNLNAGPPPLPPNPKTMAYYIWQHTDGNGYYAPSGAKRLGPR
ncbi:MAG TPA: hypothetical protein VNK04_11695 [Gemmataceae bacterium]|nr:hypothetical protein [Gemmataceae bacterium]